MKGLEDKWTASQEEKQKKKIEEKKEKAVKNKNYVTKVLAQSKTWNGPVTSKEELDRVLAIHEDIDQTIVRTELVYYKHTHKADVTARPELFRLNNISHELQRANLEELLDDENHDATNNESISLPCNEDALRFLRPVSDAPTVTQAVSAPVLPVEVNELCVTVWESGWYLGCVLEITQSSVLVDHLVRVSKDSDQI